jgi:hypothetical protein
MFGPKNGRRQPRVSPTWCRSRAMRRLLGRWILVCGSCVPMVGHSGDHELLPSAPQLPGEWTLQIPQASCDRGPIWSVNARSTPDRANILCSTNLTAACAELRDANRALSAIQGGKTGAAPAGDRWSAHAGRAVRDLSPPRELTRIRSVAGRPWTNFTIGCQLLANADGSLMALEHIGALARFLALRGADILSA